MIDIKPFWFFIAGLLLLYIFAALVAPPRHARGYRPDLAPHMLGPGGTRQLLGSVEGFFDAGAQFFMFGVDRCPYCVKAKPEFAALGSTVTIGGVTVANRVVDPEQEPQVAAGFEISGYPTFYLVKGGQKIRYTGERTTAAFRAFLEQQLAA
jgi:thiol-disulfide isomerase/thioredoxin